MTPINIKTTKTKTVHINDSRPVKVSYIDADIDYNGTQSDWDNEVRDDDDDEIDYCQVDITNADFCDANDNYLTNASDFLTDNVLENKKTINGFDYFAYTKHDYTIKYLTYMDVFGLKWKSKQNNDHDTSNLIQDNSRTIPITLHVHGSYRLGKSWREWDGEYKLVVKDNKYVLIDNE
ncbi:hypothetical protein [Limosilactobacillus reuteri]|uniref:hypothetical protein n=1 Tax=Limosilactobacillus reuteri TaxID=1598 RepID=UPI000A1DCB93|nr:hypothetical protein [Limosilactobacillus reuteri]